MAAGVEQPREFFLAELRDRIAVGEYSVDSGALADELLWRLGVVSRVGRDLSEGHPSARARTHESGRSHRPGL